MKRCFNLASFALIRNNLRLAEYYLSKASSIDPSSPNLEKMQNLLRKKLLSSKPYVFKEVWSVSSKTKV